MADCAKAHNVPIRIGVNGGSLSPKVREQYGTNSSEALVASAMENEKLLEDVG